MSTYFTTDPERIPFEAIKKVISRHRDMEIRSSKCGSPVITCPDYRDHTSGHQNWLHLLIDADDGTLSECFRNGASDPRDIIEYLEVSLNCKFISEHESAYWD